MHCLYLDLIQIMKRIIGNSLSNVLLLFVITMLTVSGCKKNGKNELIKDGLSTYIINLPGDILASIGSADGKEQRDFYPLLFSFKDGSHHLLKNATDSAQYLKTTLWDLAFTGSYNSEIFLNNANYIHNPGYQGPATRSAVIKVDRAYSNVTEAPDDSVFDNSEITKIGWASSTNSNGWFFYSLNNHISVSIKNRTYIMRLPNGKYAKFEMQSAYKDNPAIVTDIFWPSPYLNFRYFVQQDGSKNLKTN